MPKNKISFSKTKVYDYFEHLHDDKIIELLSKKRYDAEIKGDKLFVDIPPYRSDIMHPVDVIEDIIIAFGINNVELAELTAHTTGSLTEKTEWHNLVREATMGCGLQEVMTFTLTSKDKQYTKLLYLKEPVEIANPMSKNIAIFREKIFPEHLEMLSKNQHISYPQNIFEVGRVVELNKGSADEKNRLTCTLCFNKVTLTHIQGILNSILGNIGAKNIKILEKSYPWFLEGRSGEIQFELNGVKCKGYFGEVHPQVLHNFNLEMPCALFEIGIDK